MANSYNYSQLSTNRSMDGILSLAYVVARRATEDFWFHP